MQPEARRAEVHDAILRAFSSLAQPRGAELAPHQCDECDELRASLSSHPFDRVPDEMLDSQYSSLPLLGPLGLQYYLPAYMLRALKEPDWFGVENLLHHLNADISRKREYWAARLAVFTPQQRAAVLAFLAWLESNSSEPTYVSEAIGAREIWKQAA